MTEQEKHELTTYITSACSWNGVDICDVFMDALTDANFHNLRKELAICIANSENI